MRKMWKDGSTNTICSFGNRSSSPVMIHSDRFSTIMSPGMDVKMLLYGVGSTL